MLIIMCAGATALVGARALRRYNDRRATPPINIVDQQTKEEAVHEHAGRR